MQSRVTRKESEKKALIEKLSGANYSLMFFYDEPPDVELSTEPIGENVNVIHPPYNYDSLERWLYCGNWQAIYPPNKAFEPFDAFRTSDVEIQNIMQKFGVKLIIDSFPDDIEWKLMDET
jgi:hypothetical protein